MASYDLDEKTMEAIEFVKPHLDSEFKFVRVASDLAVADLIQYGYVEWSLWDSDQVVESVRKVAEHFTEEIMEETQTAVELDQMLDGMVDANENVDLIQTLSGMRQGMLDLMEVSENYLILHESIVNTCNNGG